MAIQLRISPEQDSRRAQVVVDKGWTLITRPLIDNDSPDLRPAEAQLHLEGIAFRRRNGNGAKEGHARVRNPARYT